MSVATIERCDIDRDLAIPELESVVNMPAAPGVVEAELADLGFDELSAQLDAVAELERTFALVPA